MQLFALYVRSKFYIQRSNIKGQSSKLSFFVNKIQRREIKRALIGFQLTPFWLAKDALLKSY